MNKKVAVWLDSPTKNGKSVLEYLAELISVNNGSLEVQQFGTVIPNDSHWGRSGLNLEEALDLINLSSFIKGMMFFLGDEIWEIKELIQAEINRLEKGSCLYVPTAQETQTFGSGEAVFAAMRKRQEEMARSRRSS